MLALIAGQGALPHLVKAQSGADCLVCEIEGFPSGLDPDLTFRIETLGSFLAALRRKGARQVCFAGAIRRPPLDAGAVDEETMPLVPRIMQALGQGDDAALRTVIGIFEEAGLAVVGADEIVPGLLPPPGIPTAAQPGARDRKDAERAAEVQRILGSADIGQACVVAAGQALAIETLGGTDWMLASLSGGQRPQGPAGGLLYKAPKPGQDRRIDLPAIGPATVAGAAAAGLSGIAIEAGGVMVLDRDEVVAAADAAGLFLWIRPA